MWLDRPITTAVATAPRQSYGSTLNIRLQAHRSEGRAETTLGRNREPNRGIGHWLAFGSQRYNRTAAFYCRGDPLPVAISQALEMGVQVRDVLPQPLAMCGMSFQIVRPVMQLLMLAFQVLTGANQSLMLVFEAVVHT